MEAPEIAAIITAIGGLGTGWFGGLKIGRSQQVEEFKNILSETRNMHHECEEFKAEVDR